MGRGARARPQKRGGVGERKRRPTFTFPRNKRKERIEKRERKKKERRKGKVWRARFAPEFHIFREKKGSDGSGGKKGGKGRGNSTLPSRRKKKEVDKWDPEEKEEGREERGREV